MSKELVKPKKGQSPAVQNANFLGDISPADIEIPYLKVIQGTTNTDGFDAQLGDFVHSAGNTVVGGLKKPVPFLYVGLVKKEFSIERVIPGKPNQWVRNDLYELGLDNYQSRSFTEDDEQLARFKIIYLHILLEGHMFPTTLKLRSTGLKCASSIFMGAMSLQNEGLAPWGRFMNLTSTKVTKGSNRYIEMSAVVTDKEPKDELSNRAAFWGEYLKAQKTQPNLNEQAKAAAPVKTETVTDEEIPF